MFTTLNYHVLPNFHTILKIKFGNFENNFLPKTLTLLVFNSFKNKKYFLYKDPIPDYLKIFLVYKFTCTNCSSSYIAETCCHLRTKIQETY